MFVFFLHKYLSMGLLGCRTGVCLVLIRNCWVIFQNGYSILHTCNTQKRSKIKFPFIPLLVISIDCGCIERKGEDGIEMHTLSRWVMLFVYTQNIYFSAPKWLKRVFGCSARLCPEFRAALQISSENLLGHKVTFQALEAVPSVVLLMASDNVEYWEPEYGTSFKSASSKFYSSSQLPNNRLLLAPHINAFKFWPLAILCS